VNRRRSLLWIWAGAIYALLYLPILVMMVQSVNASKFSGRWGGFTLEWYRSLLTREEITAALMNSLVIGSVSTAIAVVLGTSAAMALRRAAPRGWRILEPLLMCPVILPDIVIGIALLLLFALLRIELGRISVILAHVTFSMVYVLIVVRVRLKGIDPALEEAARDLGATPFTTFRKVTLPLILPGVVAGGLLAFTLSFEDFVITFFTSGVGATTLPLQIYSMMKFGVSPAIAALSTIFVILTALATLMLQVVRGREKA
jgi:spermidine/putrescine transport system permease protein